MTGYCVVVANADRARVFVTREAVQPEVESGPNLVESAEMQIAGGEEHKNAADEGYFVKKLIADSVHLLRRNGGRHLVLVAAAPILGKLREVCGALDYLGVEVAVYEGELMALTPQALQATLADAGLVPRCEFATGLVAN